MNVDFLQLSIKIAQLHEEISKQADLFPTPKVDYASYLKNLTSQMRPASSYAPVQAVDPLKNNGRFYLPAAPGSQPQQPFANPLPMLGSVGTQVQNAANPVLAAVRSNADRLNAGLLQRAGQGLVRGWNSMYNRWKGKR